MTIATATSTRPVKSNSRTPEVLSHDEVVRLIQEELQLALESLKRKAQRKNGIKTMRTSMRPSGLIFGATVETKDGEIRTMACRFGVEVGKKNHGLRYKHKDHGLFGIFEMINSSTNLKRTLLKLTEEIADLERRLSVKQSRKRKAQLEKTLAAKKAQLANPILKPSYRSINIEGLKGLRIRGRRIQVEGCSK